MNQFSVPSFCEADNNPLFAILSEGCQALGLALSEQQAQQLVKYVETLNQWNKTYNLTAVRNPEEMMKRHVLDALSVIHYVEKIPHQSIADIGTGGGVPGIILAILFPESEIYLVESIGKKCRFLRQAITVLQLKNAQVVQQRVEQWQLEQPLAIIICRAFTSLENFTTITQHLGDTSTQWLAMKSAYTAEEELQLPSNFRLINNQQLDVPFEEAQRHLLVINLIENS